MCSAEPPNPRKKKPLTELEMALKREETARKRKTISEKKLEDEKVRNNIITIDGHAHAVSRRKPSIVCLRSNRAVKVGVMLCRRRKTDQLRALVMGKTR